MFGTIHIPVDEVVVHSPTHTVLKRNPDRPRPSEFRTISDLRKINDALAKDDVFPVWAPSISNVVTRIISLKRQYHSVRSLLSKRDVSNAFKRALVHPDCVSVMSHQFDGGRCEASCGFAIGFLAFPFGFLASPAYFALVTTPMQLIRQAMGPSRAEQFGSDGYSCILYIDGGIFTGPELAQRHVDCVQSWGNITRSIIGETAISEEKPLLRVIASGKWLSSVSWSTPTRWKSLRQWKRLKALGFGPLRILTVRVGNMPPLKIRKRPGDCSHIGLIRHYFGGSVLNLSIYCPPALMNCALKFLARAVSYGKTIGVLLIYYDNVSAMEIFGRICLLVAWGECARSKNVSLIPLHVVIALLMV